MALDWSKTKASVECEWASQPSFVCATPSHTPHGVPVETQLLRLDDGAMWVAGRYRRALEDAGLGDFEAVMTTLDARCLRVLEDRENWYLRVPRAGQRPLGMYLKKHRIRTSWTRASARRWIAPIASAGRVEAQNILALTALGIETMNLVAYGERLRTDGQLESFLLTEELEGYLELQDFVARRFPVARRGDRDECEFRRLVRQVAGIARRFHAAGYNHRDFNCYHFLVKETAPGEFDIRLIDLQRMQHRSRFRRRWIVKDLAQLACTAPAEHVRCRDKVAFLRDYLGVRRIGPRDRRLIRAVLWKEFLIRRRLGRKS